MQFEDILKEAAKFWSLPIEVNKISIYYFEQVADAWKDLDDKHKYWVELLNWSIGVMLSKISEDINYKDLKVVSLNDIPIRLLEKRFNEVDLQGETWKKERKEYKGFRNIPDVSQLITKDYLNNL